MSLFLLNINVSSKSNLLSDKDNLVYKKIGRITHGLLIASKKADFSFYTIRVFTIKIINRRK